MQMAGNRRHGTKLFAKIEPAIGGFEIGVAEVDQRHDVIMADGLNGLGHLGRRLTILAGFGGEDILKRDPHAIGLAEFRQLSASRSRASASARSAIWSARRAPPC